MKTKVILSVAAAAALATTSAASAVTINFDNLAVGTTLSTQYAGVTFAPNAFSGSGGPNGSWATNTNMTIVSATGSDVGALGTPSLVSGNLLRSYNGWLSENGDPSFSISFASAISSFSAAFAGVAIPADTRLFLYNGSTLLSTVAGPTTTTGQFVLSYSAASITKVIVTPGDFNDWVGVDNINYAPVATGAVPEPATWAMMIAGFGLTGAALRRRTARVAIA